MITFALLRWGEAYSLDYVTRLRNMINRHYGGPKRIICLTDKPTPIDGVDMVDVAAYGLPKWWSKMLLFDPSIRGGNCVYFDLDTVILKDLTPLVAFREPFAICENFTRLAGHTRWPCRYGSCVMRFDATFGLHVFEAFLRNREKLMAEGVSYGDQYIIEKLVPHALLLQDHLPSGFFQGYRTFTSDAPSATVAIFAGRNKPHNSPFEWVRKEWK